MTAQIAGTLPADEIEEAAYAVHFWAEEARNHLFRRAEVDDPVHDVLEPQCTRGRVIPARWVFRSELSDEHGGDRDRPREGRLCFRRR
ncbi:hypothetical protein [Amycolatopsis sp. FDAARGOS 1241]|uniref:hypothetical protein n=1 Tax=Amycolatopsis sp. FDAARGOS 1241 TaxID=2778070 RepID=UPI00194FA5BB|nr:hypothetical protein [Amycolatopsis sp. FDAARGOS 1241]QRP44657.1 hypothetical protein I6J71_36265 [Amycolatopsis sp. FDAARGOS 1241]